MKWGLAAPLVSPRDRREYLPMAESVPVPRAEFAQLSQDGKLAHIEHLYDIVDAQGVERTDEQRALLDQRLRQHRADPSSSRSWSEVRDELLQRWR